MFGITKFVAWLAVVALASWMLGAVWFIGAPAMADRIETAAMATATAVIAWTESLPGRPLLVIALLMIVHYIFDGVQDLRHTIRQTPKCTTRREKMKMALRNVGYAALNIGIPVLFVLCCEPHDANHTGGIVQLTERQIVI